MKFKPAGGSFSDVDKRVGVPRTAAGMRRTLIEGASGGVLDPTDGATRAETATIFMRFMGEVSK